LPTADLLTNHRELTAAPLNLEKALYKERLYIFCSLAERLLASERYDIRDMKKQYYNVNIKCK